jgi:hypothetical protein
MMGFDSFSIDDGLTAHGNSEPFSRCGGFENAFTYGFPAEDCRSAAAKSCQFFR